MNFEFATAGRILYGRGRVQQVASLTQQLGKRALLVSGKSPRNSAGLQDQFESIRMPYTIFRIENEPTIEDVVQGVRHARDGDCDVVVAIGGGSVIDGGKAIAALTANGGTPLDYLEVIGEGKALADPSIPLVAIPTTAGTGAEVTRNAVLHSPEHGVKVSLRSRYMLPDIALIDPALTLSLPPSETAWTGLDALTQCLEPYVSNQANPLSDGLAREGLRRAARSLERAYMDGQDIDAREDMAVASLCGGLALANAKLGAVHGFAGVLGGMYQAPHGLVCAALLPWVTEANVDGLSEQKTTTLLSSTLARYDEIARLLTGETEACATDGVRWLHDLCVRLNIPGLDDYGLREADFAEVVMKSQASSSMKGNPVLLPEETLKTILHKAC